MKNKDIEKAAERSTEKYVENGDLRGFRGSYRLGFIAGADWRINSVWHYDKSMPNINEPFLLIDHKWALVLRIGCERDWAIMIKDKIFVKWAYIKDLIPNKEGEQ